LLGYSFQARCLVVSHCYRESDAITRLISARRRWGLREVPTDPNVSGSFRFYQEVHGVTDVEIRHSEALP
jgi:hypothetical protein